MATGALTLIMATGCAQEYSNALIHETSPYLLMHAHNPVDWHPWNAATLEMARKQHKPLIISIGYAACHWCHVMERETFSDTAVANYMNQHFISINVDREEHPEVDDVYLSASEIISGSGGWPLNAFALPDGRPFFAGTYFPRDQWLQVLQRVYQLYHDQPDRAREAAEQIAEGVHTASLVNSTPSDVLVSQADYKQFFYPFETQVDDHWGGLGLAPKFPEPVCWEFLLQYYYLTGEKRALNDVNVTLQRMARGGICDQVGGGFSRYSTDNYWHVPHFEKMIYDNGQLVSLYAHAYEETKDPLYAQVIRQTLDFVDRQMSDGSGGFCSSVDADSEGEEGKYYAWTTDEVNKLLGDDAPLMEDYFQMSEHGNWHDGLNILHRVYDADDFAKSKKMSAEEFGKKLDHATAILLAARQKRTMPAIDDKILTGWNALMMQGYIDAYRALGDPHYLDVAKHNAHFIVDHLLTPDGLMRNYKDGKATLPALLDDYAFLCSSLIDLYQVTFDAAWLNTARQLLDASVKHFYSAENHLFYYTSDQATAPLTRTMPTSDNVMPSPNAVMARNLYVLGDLFEDQDYQDMSRAMLLKMQPLIDKSPANYTSWASLCGLVAFGNYAIAITGTDCQSKRSVMQKEFLPTALYMGGLKEDLPLLEMKEVAGKTIIYVCKNRVCKQPVTDVNEALALVQ